MALLTKHLRMHGTLLAVMGSKKKEIKQEVLIRMSLALLDDEVRQDVIEILTNLLGREIQPSLVLGEVIDELRQAWRINKMGRLLSLCVELGVIDQEDLATAIWVAVNWSQQYGSSAAGGTDRSSVHRASDPDGENTTGA